MVQAFVKAQAVVMHHVSVMAMPQASVQVTAMDMLINRAVP
jgi:hypothetical protein